jgi:hypothetical protein
LRKSGESDKIGLSSIQSFRFLAESASNPRFPAEDLLFKGSTLSKFFFDGKPFGLALLASEDVMSVSLWCRDRSRASFQLFKIKSYVILLGVFENLGLLLLASASFSLILGVVMIDLEDVMYVRAVYRLPRGKNVIFILSLPQDILDMLQISMPDREKGIERFDRILQSKDSTESTKCLWWTATALPESDFVASIEKNNRKEERRANPSYRSPECMELLTIDLVKNHQSNVDPSFETQKILTIPSRDDILEISI